MENEDFLHLPPGFRFHPSDEELINYYLLNKVNMRPIPASVIGEIELYNFDPWDLPSKILLFLLLYLLCRLRIDRVSV